MSEFAEIATVPVDQLIESVATGIANAQYQLDLTSLKIAQRMSGLDKESRVSLGSKTYSLLELGFTPTFYQFIETVIEVKVSISTSTTDTSSTKDTTTSSSKDKTWGITSSTVTANASSVTASYASKYQYSGEASSLIRTKIVPVPAPALLSERIRALVAAEEKAQAEAEKGLLT